MERVAFHVESTGERIPCLLNPDTLVVRRQVGVRRRRSLMGPASTQVLADDPLILTGGGTTELELELLFDVDLVSVRQPPADPAERDREPERTDVRELTQPLWRMSEHVEGSPAGGEAARPPVVRLVWGKAWNVPAVVSAVAERLERFGPDGAPRRSWMRLRLLRVPDPARTGAPPASGTTPASEPEPIAVHEVVGAGTSGAPEPGPQSAADATQATTVPGERLDELANRYYGDPTLWRLIAEENGIDDPLRVAPGSVLRIPPRSAR